MVLLTVADDACILQVDAIILPKVIMVALVDEVLRTSACHLVQPDVPASQAKPSVMWLKRNTIITALMQTDSHPHSGTGMGQYLA